MDHGKSTFLACEGGDSPDGPGGPVVRELATAYRNTKAGAIAGAGQIGKTTGRSFCPSAKPQYFIVTIPPETEKLLIVSAVPELSL